jgi:hypothetical protein
MPSLSIANNTFENIVQELPSGIVASAREHKAFSRSRAVRDPIELLRAVLLYCGLDYSLREVAANFTRVGRRLSDEAVRARLCGCESWLRAILQEMLTAGVQEIGSGIRRLILIDGTTIQARGATTSDYRIHLGWDWIEQRVVHSLVTDNRTSESLKLFNWQPGDLAIADAAYATAQQLSGVSESGAEYIVRCAASNIRLFSPEGERIHVADELSKQEGRSVVSIEVQIKSGIGMETAYVHAFRLPQEAVVKARAKIRKKSIRTGHKTKAETIYLAEWMLLLTSIEPERIPAETIAKLYRSRWQIELVIKRLKSILKIDALRAKRGSQLAQVYLLGKIIYALMIEKRAISAVADRTVEWRIWKMVAEKLRPQITLSDSQNEVIGPEVLKVLKERSRKRQRLRDKITVAVQQIQRKHIYFNSLCP